MRLESFNALAKALGYLYGLPTAMSTKRDRFLRAAQQIFPSRTAAHFLHKWRNHHQQNQKDHHPKREASAPKPANFFIPVLPKHLPKNLSPQPSNSNPQSPHRPPEPASSPQRYPSRHGRVGSVVSNRVLPGTASRRANSP